MIDWDDLPIDIHRDDLTIDDVAVPPPSFMALQVRGTVLPDDEVRDL